MWLVSSGLFPTIIRTSYRKNNMHICDIVHIIPIVCLLIRRRTEHDSQKSLFFRSRLLHRSVWSWLTYQQTMGCHIIITGRRRVALRLCDVNETDFSDFQTTYSGVYLGVTPLHSIEGVNRAQVKNVISSCSRLRPNHKQGPHL